MGYASAIVVVFFVLILLVTLLLLTARRVQAGRIVKQTPARPHRASCFSIVMLISPALLVFLWMLSLSLKNEADNTAFPPVFIPNPPTLANFVDVFATQRLPRIHHGTRWSCRSAPPRSPC